MTPSRKVAARARTHRSAPVTSPRQPRRTGQRRGEHGPGARRVAIVIARSPRGGVPGAGQHVRFGIHSGDGTHPAGDRQGELPGPAAKSMTTSSLVRPKAPMSVSITAGG